jgi:uncharacterized protein (DUF2336 family)
VRVCARARREKPTPREQVEDLLGILLNDVEKRAERRMAQQEHR